MIKIISATALLLFSLGNAQAAMVNFTIIGDVLSGNEFAPNAFGLTAGDTITAYGSFETDDLVGGAGIISFDTGSGNSLTIDVGTATYFASDDIFFGSGGPTIELTGLNLVTGLATLVDFDFFASDASFNSNFTSFDDFDQMFGDWRTEVVVPVPAAAWLFGSGLLGLVGLARRKAA